MNYLAHAHLSFRDPQILIGNMIADYVKGKQILAFDEKIQQGIRIHRLIDEFTDKHPIVKETKGVFRESAGRYDGSFLDIAYDHFLALDGSEEPAEGWLDFTLDCYSLLDDNAILLPDGFANFFKYMKIENWLYNYRYRWLIEKNFGRFANHLQYLPDSGNASIYKAFDNNYELLNESYRTFYPELKGFVMNLE